MYIECVLWLNLLISAASINPLSLISAGSAASINPLNLISAGIKNAPASEITGNIVTAPLKVVQEFATAKLYVRNVTRREVSKVSAEIKEVIMDMPRLMLNGEAEPAIKKVVELVANAVDEVIGSAYAYISAVPVGAGKGLTDIVDSIGYECFEKMFD